MLDKTKKFGQVCGMSGVKFEQGGKLFNVSGEEVDETGVLVKKTPVKPAPPVKIEEDLPLLSQPVEEEVKPKPKRSRWSKP